MHTQFSRVVLLLSWLSALTAMIIISLYYAGESRQFFGVADDQEQTIRFTKPVEIVSYGFVPGQEVAAGDLVLEVQREELVTELQMVHEKIQALKFGNREARATMQSEIVQQKADLQATLTGLDSQIRRLRGQETAAMDFLSKLGAAKPAGEDSAVGQDIASLEQHKRALIKATNAKVQDLQSRLAMPERSVDARIAELTKRQQDLQRQKAELRVYASINGRVGSIHFKVGDTVPPYQPVVTVHGSKPSFIKGYIHENVLNGVRLNQPVWVRSANSSTADGWYEGVVESLGSRIVEFPSRLKVNPLAQAWGREVIVRIGDNNKLLLGQKVEVQLEPPMQGLDYINAYAGEQTP